MYKVRAYTYARSYSFSPNAFCETAANENLLEKIVIGSDMQKNVARQGQQELALPTSL